MKINYPLIKKKMSDRGWSYYMLAKKCGVPINAFYTLENQKMKMLMLDRAVLIAKALDIENVSQLVMED